MNTLHIRKGDKVKVISGKDRGKTGTVVKALPKEGRVVVEGVNIVKRATKGRGNQSGRVVEKPAPIHASNVAKV